MSMYKSFCVGTWIVHNAAPSSTVPRWDMRAFCQHTRKRFEPTHGDVLNLHTERSEKEAGWFSSLFLVPSLFRRSLPSYFSRSLSLLSSLSDRSSQLSVFLLSMTMTMIALANSLLDEHVRIMQEATVQVFLCKPRATWNEVGMYLCW